MSTASAAAAAPAEAAAPPPAAPVPVSRLTRSPVPAVRTYEQPAPLAAKEKKPHAEASTTTPDLDEVLVPLGDRRYRLRGLKKNLAWGVLKLNVLVTREGPEAEALFAPPSPLSGFFVDTLDLYSARQRAAFEKQAAHELGLIEETIKRDLGQLLRRAEELQQESIRKTLEPKEKAVLLSEEETAEALAFLSDPNSSPASSKTSRPSASSARTPTSSPATSRPSLGSSRSLWRSSSSPALRRGSRPSWRPSSASSRRRSARSTRP